MFRAESKVELEQFPISPKHLTFQTFPNLPFVENHVYEPPTFFEPCSARDTQDNFADNKTTNNLKIKPTKVVLRIV